jgi:hypothetical protein
MRALLTFPLLLLATLVTLSHHGSASPGPAPLCLTDGINGKCPILACVAVDCLSYGCFSECDEGCARFGCLVERETCDDNGGICRCLCGGLEKV